MQTLQAKCSSFISACFTQCNCKRCRSRLSVARIAKAAGQRLLIYQRFAIALAKRCGPKLLIISVYSNCKRCRPKAPHFSAFALPMQLQTLRTKRFSFSVFTRIANAAGQRLLISQRLLYSMQLQTLRTKRFSFSVFAELQTLQAISRFCTPKAISQRLFT
jgi:hypothetical protein